MFVPSRRAARQRNLTPRMANYAVGGLLLVSLAGLSVARAAALPCNTEQNRSLFELEALKSELMVVATDCHDSDQYNAFIQKYQPQLAGAEREMDGYFSRAYGKRGQQVHDRYVTDLANSDAHSAHQLGNDFCARNAAMFNEVMALRSPADLPAYAAGKDLVPVDLGACNEVPSTSTAPIHHVRGRRAHAR